MFVKEIKNCKGGRSDNNGKEGKSGNTGKRVGVIS